MKEKIRSAQIVVPCADVNRTLEFFIERFGFRLEMIFPADAPSVAVISGFGVTLRLEKSSENLPLTIRLEGDFSDQKEREIFSPDGVRLQLIDKKSAVEIPEGEQEFVLTTHDGDWSEGRAGMQYRDLVPGRLGGRFVASHIRIPEGGEIPDYVHYHKIRFQMIYCLSGWARLVYEDQGEPFLMRAGDCVLQPSEIRHRVLESSPKFEVLEISCPAVHETFADHELNLPNAVMPERIFGGQQFVHHTAENTVWSDSEIEGFEACDTGISAATGGLAEVRLFHAISDAKFSVNHSGEFLFFFVLKGHLKLQGADRIYNLNEGDSFVLPAGNEYLIDAAKGFKILRVGLPAE